MHGSNGVSSSSSSVAGALETCSNRMELGKEDMEEEADVLKRVENGGPSR